jgi:hypothetical protein
MRKNRTLKTGQCCSQCRFWSTSAKVYHDCFIKSQAMSRESGTLCKYFSRTADPLLFSEGNLSTQREIGPPGGTGATVDAVARADKSVKS